jgi:hypothetical protein
MSITRFNPPFTNPTLETFFDYHSDQKETILFMRTWIEANYPELTIALAYHVPFYSLGKEKVLYFHYVKNDDTNDLEFEISFVKGDKIVDKYNLFQAKNKKTKSILIRETYDWFLEEFRYYMDQSLMPIR